MGKEEAGLITKHAVPRDKFYTFSPWCPRIYSTQGQCTLMAGRYTGGWKLERKGTAPPVLDHDCRSLPARK